MHKIIKILVLLAGIWQLGGEGSTLMGQNSTGDEMATVRLRMKGTIVKCQWENVSTERALELLQDDGSFSDERPQMKHMTGRLLTMTQDYVGGEKKMSSADLKGNACLKKNAALKDKIYLSLQYWLDNRPKYKFPGMPFSTLRACAAIELALYDDMMSDRHVSDERRKQIDRLQKSINDFSHWCWYNGKSPDVFDKNEGHNRGGNLGYRLWGMTAIAACSGLQQEMDWVRSLVAAQFPDVVNSATERPTGKTPDGSWIQHNGGGAQNYWVGYGVHWVNYAQSYARYTIGTRWELKSSEFDVLASYYLDGLRWYYYNNHGALNLAGRHNALKESPQDNGYLRRKATELLKVANGQLTRAEELKGMINGMRDPHIAAMDSTKYFWNTDLLVHSRPGSYFAIKMLSNRTTGCESSESSRAHGKNNFLSGDGSTMILHAGSEYDDARVGWNWRAIPGITAIQKDGKLPLTPWGKYSKSLNVFAGGLTDGFVGVAGFRYHRKHNYVNLRAHKGYFTFDNTMVAMGNGITKVKSGDGSVWTTVDQSHREGAVYYCINGKNGRIKSGKQKVKVFEHLASPSWVYHDNTGYLLFPQKNNVAVRLFAQRRVGNWADLDGRYDTPKNKPTNEQQVDIFQLSLDHGDSPNGSNYIYAVIPGIAKKQLIDKIGDGSWVFPVNDDNVQAFYNKKTNHLMAVFYKATTVEVSTTVGSAVVINGKSNNLSVTSSQPVVLSLEKKAIDWQLTVADPLHGQDSVELEIVYGGKTCKIIVAFPRYPLVGKSKNVNIKLR